MVPVVGAGLRPARTPSVSDEGAHVERGGCRAGRLQGSGAMRAAHRRSMMSGRWVPSARARRALACGRNRWKGLVVRRRLRLVGCAALLALSVAACGESSAGKATTSAASAATAAPTAAEAAAASTSAAVATGDAAAGKQLAASAGCVVCHSANGRVGMGPTWKGVFEHDVELDNGAKVRADEAYLRESIVNPAAKVVKGFLAGVMPAVYGQQFGPEQLNQLIAYIKSLK